MSDALFGFQRLAEQHGIQLVQALFTRSRLVRCASARRLMGNKS